MDTIDLERLTEAQKRQLYQELAFTYGRQGGKSVAETWTDDEQAIWAAINDVVRSKRSLGEVFARTGKEATRDQFAEDVEYITSWIDRGCGHPVNRRQRQALIDTAIDCLGRYLERGNVPVLHRTMLQNLSKTPTAVGRCFPGYAEARILDRLAAIAA